MSETILPPEVNDQIREHLKTLADARRLAEKLQRAGYDQSDRLADIAKIEEQLRALRREFFPSS
jgi:hypothetical protein